MLKAKNFDELEKALSGYGITMTNKVKQLHFSSVSKAVGGVAAVIDMFPCLKGQIRKIDTWHNNNWLISTSWDGTVYFNYNRYNKIMPIKEKKLNECINGRWHHPVNMGYDGQGSHEAGHMLIKAYIDKRYADKSENYRYQIWNNSSVAKDILITVCKQNNASLYNLKKKMCRYAETNESECIAECICDFFTNGYKACELSQLVVKFFREEL